jgi:uncharacterized protein YfiM (DUF2279 family)
MKPIIVLLLIFFMSTIMSFAQAISEDDLKHFGAGIAISGATYAIVYSSTKNKKKAFWYGLGAAILAGLVKETFDSNKFNSKLDTSEVLATALGGLTATVSLDLFVGKRKNKHVSFVPVE